MIRLLWTQKQDIGPPLRTQHVMAYDSMRGQTVLFGGKLNAGGGLTNDTWEWDGGNWTQVHDVGPPARIGHAMAFDSARGRTVCFGGLANEQDTGSTFNDTWEWDGTDWTEMANTGPGGRSFHTMAYDSTRGRTVLFGGQVPGAFLGDTWEWDGATWTQAAGTGPSPRDACGSAYDTTRQRLVIYGGETLNGTQIVNVGETWELAVGSWTQMSMLGPGPIVGPLMAYVAAYTLLYNPADGTTWSWDGAHWTERQKLGPGMQAPASLVYDSQRKRAVLCGAGQTQTTWELAEVP